jgi:hypothetical protein
LVVISTAGEICSKLRFLKPQNIHIKPFGMTSAFIKKKTATPNLQQGIAVWFT